MPSNDNKPITEGLLDKKLEEKDHSNNICQNVTFVFIIIADFINTVKILLLISFPGIFPFHSVINLRFFMLYE